MTIRPIRLDARQRRIGPSQVLFRQLATSRRRSSARDRRSERVRPVARLHDEREWVVVLVIVVVDTAPAWGGLARLSYGITELQVTAHNLMIPAPNIQ